MFTWRVHTGLLDGRESDLLEVIKNFGDSVQLVSGHWRTIEPPLASLNGEVGGLALTTLQDARRLLVSKWHELGNGTRRIYFDERKYDVSFWAPRLSSEIPILNRKCLFTPLGLVSRLPLTFGQHGFPPASGILFVRPDSGLKPFPGIAIDCHRLGISNWASVATELASVAHNSNPDRMVCIAPGRNLSAVEWRFWVVNRQVVSSSPYSWEEGPLKWVEPPSEALRLAEAVSWNQWQPDIAYVVDVVEVLEGQESKFFVNELNAASTSGLYCAPLQPLMAALRDAVVAEIRGELTVEG